MFLDIMFVFLSLSPDLVCVFSFQADANSFLLFEGKNDTIKGEPGI
jgi:hypothetical protein